MELWRAVDRNKMERVGELLLKGCDVNFVNPHDYLGRSVLHLACLYGRADIASELLQKPELDINIGDKQGCTPLFYACNYRRTELVKLLLQDSRLQVCKANKWGWTPLFVASRHGKSDIVRLLVRDDRTDLTCVTTAETGDHPVGTTALEAARQGETEEKRYYESNEECIKRKQGCKEAIHFIEEERDIRFIKTHNVSQKPKPLSFLRVKFLWKYFPKFSNIIKESVELRTISLVFLLSYLFLSRKRQRNLRITQSTTTTTTKTEKTPKSKSSD